MSLKTLLKIIFIGFCTTVCRIVGQMLIPAGSQNVLAPSQFVENGTMPIAFSIYGLFVYGIIASMFFLLRDRISGSKMLQGFKYGISCCVIWIVYLLEPLPHVALFDKVTYPLADSMALIVMGILGGLFFGKENRKSIEKFQFPIVSFITITLFFASGRMIQYKVINIYSSFDTKTSETILWSIITGICISGVMIWLYNYIPHFHVCVRALVLGCVLFGMDLLLFNFFMPLVFSADIPDLIIRTGMDVLCVTIGCLFFKDKNEKVYFEDTNSKLLVN